MLNIFFFLRAKVTNEVSEIPEIKPVANKLAFSQKSIERSFGIYPFD